MKTETAHEPATGTLRSDLIDGLKRGALIGLVVAAVLVPAVAWHDRPSARHPQAGAAVATAASLDREAPGSARLNEAARPVRVADFQGEPFSPLARQVADWIAASNDNQSMDFVIVDKKHTKVYVFDAQARLKGATPVLLGAAPGDDTVPGIGSRPIAEVRPEERTTPAGRFVGERGRNTLGEDVVWVDYDAAVSMHRVRVTNAHERRLERLATPTTDDNRISYGCINVPVAFYEAVVRPTFAKQRAVVYVLPEVKPVQEVFAVAGSVPAVASQRLAATAPGARSNPSPRT